MANTTWYGDGTATVAVGSRSVIGTDTGWLTEVAGLTPIKAGDKYGIHVGRPIVIEQIISDTELLLADDWPGPAQTDAPYKVELTSPTIAAVEAMRRLLASLSNGNLDSLSEIAVGTDDIPIGIGPGVFGTISRSSLSGITASLAALAALTPAANKLAYFTGANAAALTDLTALARSLLDDTTGAAMFATMGATSGAGWVKLPNGRLFQHASSVVTTDAGGNVGVFFPTAFASGTSYNVVAWAGDSAVLSGRLLISQLRSTPWPQATGFAVQARESNTGAPVISGGIRVDWIAIGTAP